MFKPLHLVICSLATACINHMECIKLTPENMISLGGVNYNFNFNHISEIDPAALGVINCTSLDLEGNELTYLQADLFQNNTNFEALRLETNKISKIHPLVFQNLQNLSRIDLDENELTEIAENLFEKNTKLREINISNNRITFFDPNSFSNLKNLEYLDISYNQLTSFDFNLLSSSKELKQLYLDKNNLTEIHYEDLKLRFPKLKEVSFTQNKFNCSFAKQIKDYLDEKHIVVYRGSISCISDEEYAAIQRDRYINTPVSNRQLSAELENMQLKLEEKFNKITSELRNYVAKIENANEKIIIESAKVKGDNENMNNVIKDLKLQLLEQQSVTDELQFLTESCCDMTI